MSEDIIAQISQAINAWMQEPLGGQRQLGLEPGLVTRWTPADAATNGKIASLDLAAYLAGTTGLFCFVAIDFHDNLEVLGGVSKHRDASAGGAEITVTPMEYRDNAVTAVCPFAGVAEGGHLDIVEVQNEEPEADAGPDEAPAAAGEAAASAETETETPAPATDAPTETSGDQSTSDSEASADKTGA